MFVCDDLFRMVNALKRENKKIISNCFLTPKELQNFSVQQTSFLLSNTKALALFVQDNNVNRVYFYLASLDHVESLVELLKQHPLEKPYIIECVGKEQQLNEWQAHFEKCGIELYTKLSRWRTNKLTGLLPVKDKGMIRMASVEDVEKIQFVFNHVFDPFVSHLPSDDRLKQLIEDKSVYCGILDNDVVAAYCCEKVGSKSLYLYQDAVLEKFNGSGLGVLMLHYVLGRNNTFMDYNCWIEDKNNVSQKMHRKLGFKTDGLKSSIFIYR